MADHRGDVEGIRNLLDPAILALGAMVTPSGLCCYEVDEDDPPLKGESARYTLVALLGLLKAEADQREVPVDLEQLREAVDNRIARSEIGAGDLGLRLWVEARSPRGHAEALVARLESALETAGIARLIGTELAWVILGLATISERTETPSVRRLLGRALDQLVDGNRGASGLFLHSGRGLRRRFPNFATEIYGILALAVVACLGIDDRALGAGKRAADVLLSLQLSDGAWPWLFDADRGIVVEPYGIYAVHQHGMAPMALSELSKASGDPRYAAAAEAGLQWALGANELRQHMMPLERGMTYRSIRRKPPLNRLYLYANATSVATLRRRAFGIGSSTVELDRTCRPYELGWLIEAWSDRRE
jgi:hypothetical protein